MTNARCTGCGALTELFCSPSDSPRCECGEPYEQLWWERNNQRNAEWSKDEQVVVFRKPDGTYSYPMTNTKPTPAGFERIVLKSDRELAAHERQANVVHERRHFDSNGRGIDNLRGER
jgi:hypothetical protein